MAGTKGSKYYDIFLDYAIRLEHKKKGPIIQAEDFLLLRAIENTGSIKEAARERSMSYRKAWGIIQQIEDSLGFCLLARQRGGLNGGKTTLTIEGEKLIQAHIKLRKKFDEAIHLISKEFFQEIND